MFIIKWSDRTWSGPFKQAHNALLASRDGRYELVVDGNGHPRRVLMDSLIGLENEGYNLPRVPLGQVVSSR